MNEYKSGRTPNPCIEAEG
ncbi:MAG: hypothetical protein ACKOOE_07710 [Micrococcales bacterium]